MSERPRGQEAYEELPRERFETLAYPHEDESDAPVRPGEAKHTEQDDTAAVRRQTEARKHLAALTDHVSPSDLAKTYETFDAKGQITSLLALKPDEQELSAPQRHALLRERISQYKEALVQQETGIAELVTGLYGTIEQRPDASFDELWQRVATEAPRYRMTEAQLGYFYRALEGYVSKHAAVERYRADYPDDNDLAEKALGMRPRGKVEVVKGAMSLTFRMHDKWDFATLALHKPVDELSSDEVDHVASSMGGGALRHAGEEDLANTLSIENATNGRPLDAQYSREIRRHEDQHLFNRLVAHEADPDSNLFEPVKTLREVAYDFEDFTGSKDELRDEYVVKAAREHRRPLMDERARDEILAYLVEGGRTYDEIEKELMGPAYDYARREETAQYITRLPEKIIYTGIDDLHDSLYQSPSPFDRTAVAQTVERVFGEEYRRDLKRWIGALKAMDDKGYDRTEIAMMLQQAPVGSWTALARRLPEQPDRAPRGLWDRAKGWLKDMFGRSHETPRVDTKR